MLALCGFAAVPTATAAFDPAYEQSNYSKIDERGKRDAADPEFQALLRAKGAEREAERLMITATDPERDFAANLCSRHMDGCAGDVRLYDWDKNGFGIRTPVLWVARNGAILSGHLWMTKEGPAKRPGIVVTSGSVQAPEELYWHAGATLAKRGYIVLTYDVQGQGYSDTNGEGVDRDEGVPSQAGRPFFDQTEDALDFFLSSAAEPYVPRPSCTTGTSHAARQERRVKEGRNAAFNPFAVSLDPSRIGLAGHSFGAAGVSFVGQKDPRVKAIVAWDNLRAPSAPPASNCTSAPESRTAPPITKPSLGIANDYGLFRMANTGEPDPLAKSEASRAFSAAGVDSGQVNIRGGTHYESSYIPNPYFSATLRGIDFVAWYTGAWFDKYVKGDASADARLLTTRWRDDAEEAAVDPTGDGNMFSRYYRSRLDIGLASGGRFLCEDLRPGECPGLSPADGQAAAYGYLKEANTADAPPNAGPPSEATPPVGDCRGRRRFTVGLSRPRGARIKRATLYLNGHRVRSISRRQLRASGRGRIRVPIKLRRRTTQPLRIRVVFRTDRGRVVYRRGFRPCAGSRAR